MYGKGREEFTKNMTGSTSWKVNANHRGAHAKELNIVKMLGKKIEKSKGNKKN